MRRPYVSKAERAFQAKLGARLAAREERREMRARERWRRISLGAATPADLAELGGGSSRIGRVD